MMYATSAHAQVSARPATPAELQQQVAAVREQLRTMQEQQKTLTDTLDRLQQQLGSQPVPAAPQTRPARAGCAGGSCAARGERLGRFHPAETCRALPDGIVISQTSDDAKVPFLLKYNINSQVRYLNTTSAEDTFTDHLGVVRTVNKRNDITVNRTMFILGGYMFDPRLRYSTTVWTSCGGELNRHSGEHRLAIQQGLYADGRLHRRPRQPGRSWARFHSFSRPTAPWRTISFRPGFTQGIWANGDVTHDLHYLAFVGNGLNTLNISAAKIDENLMYSGSLWWEPLGDYGPPGKSRNMYDDYYATPDLRIRLGSSFTSAREDRFFRPRYVEPREHVDVQFRWRVVVLHRRLCAGRDPWEEAQYRMWAIDGGMKWNGWSVNGQYYFRWVDDFKADGPLPVKDTYDSWLRTVGGNVHRSQEADGVWPRLGGVRTIP